MGFFHLTLFDVSEHLLDSIHSKHPQAYFVNLENIGGALHPYRRPDLWEFWMMKAFVGRAKSLLDSLLAIQHH